MIHQPCPDILKNKRILALDIESTGLSTIYNTIIELGVIEVINGEVKTEYTKLLKIQKEKVKKLLRNVLKKLLIF